MQRSIALIRLVMRRALATPGLLLIRLVGTLLAVTLVCGVSLYSGAMGDAMLQIYFHNDAESQYLAVSDTNTSLTPAVYNAVDTYVRHQMSSDLRLPLTGLYVHHNTSSMNVYRADQPLTGQTAPLASVNFDYYEGIASQVDVLDGTLSAPARTSGGELPVDLTYATAQKMHVSLGSRLVIVGRGRTTLGPPLVVAGIFVPKDPASTFWTGNGSNQTYLSVVVPRLDDFMVLQALPVDFPPSFFWRVQTDLGVINLSTAQRTVDALDRVNNEVAVLAPGAGLIESISLDINGFLGEYALLPFILYVLVVPITAVILYVVVVMTALVVQRQAAEIVLMRSRGATSSQIMGLYLWEGLLLGVLATIIGPLLGLPLAELIGHASGFLAFSGGLPFSFALGAQTFVTAGVTALVAVLICLLPALAASRTSMGAFKQEEARVSRRPLWQRLFLDIVLLALALYGYWILRGQGAISSSDSQAALAQDPVIGLAPLGFALALTLLLARTLPWLAAIALTVGQGSSAPLSISLRSVARAPRQPMRLVQLLALTLTLGVFAATVAGVVGANTTDQAMYAAGATLRLEEVNLAINDNQIAPVAVHLRFPGVQAASPALRIESNGTQQNTTSDGSVAVNMLGVDPATLPGVIWYRSDFSDESLHTLLSSIGSATSSNAIVSSNFLSATGLHMGDSFDITTAKGRLIHGRVAGVASYFPTLDPTQFPFVIFNLHYLNAAAHAHGPGEIWLKTTPDAQYLANLVTTIRQSIPREIIDYEGVPAAFSAANDPLQAGIYGVVSVGFLIALLLALLGFSAYAYLALQRRLHEFAIVRALGLSGAQLRWLLLSEQFFLLGSGIGGGLVSGVLTSRLFLPYMPITESIMPPFLITIPWPAIEQFVAVILIIFALVLTADAWLLMRLQLSRVLRLGEG